MGSNLRNKHLSIQAKEMVANIYNVCKEEGINNQFKLPLKRTFERAALYAGISTASVKRIHKEDMKRMEFPDTQLSSPSKRSRLTIKDKIDEADFGIIRRLIQKFYVEWKVVPTLRKLLQKVKENMEFPYGRDTLRRLLRRFQKVSK